MLDGLTFILIDMTFARRTISLAMPIRFFKSWNAMLILVAVFSFFSWILRSIPTIPDRTDLTFIDNKENGKRIIQDIFFFCFGLPGMVSPGIIKAGTTVHHLKVQDANSNLFSNSYLSRSIWELGKFTVPCAICQNFGNAIFQCSKSSFSKAQLYVRSCTSSHWFRILCWKKEMDPFLIS